MKAETAAMIMMSGKGKPDLEDITITENDVYQSVDHDGFNIVTVEVETYWDEYQQALSDLADALEELEDAQDQIEDLQDQLDACHDCKDQVVAAMQVIDPNYVLPASGCPDDIPTKAYQKGQESVTPALGSKFITQNGTYLASSDSLDGYDTVVVDVQDCGYTFPKDETGEVDYDKIADIIGNDNLTDEDVHIIIKAVDDREPPIPAGQHNVYYGFYDSVTGSLIDRTQAFQSTIDPEHTDYVSNFRITDPSTGAYTFDWVAYGYEFPYGYIWKHYTYSGTNSNIIGYGDPSHTYTVTKNS